MNVCTISYIETKKNNISVFHDIIFSFHTDDAFFSRSGKASVIEKILIVDYLSLDESTLKIRMNLAGSLWSLGSFLDRPCAALILTGCQETDKTK